MNRERLLRLADFLEKEVSEDRFDLSTWGNGDLSLCGTTACACGWATRIPEFAEAGFVLKSFERRLSDGEKLISYDICFDGHESFDAASAFFGLPDYEDSYHLFYVGRYLPGERTAKHVATRIREYVRKGDE